MNPSSHRSPNSVEGLTTKSTIPGIGNEYLTSTNGSLDVFGITGILPQIYDAILYTDTSATIDTYTFYQGGLGGTLVNTLTITYTDTTKSVIQSVVRT